MTLCPVCNNDTFEYHGHGTDRVAVCTVCREESYDDAMDEEVEDGE